MSIRPVATSIFTPLTPPVNSPRKDTLEFELSRIQDRVKADSGDETVYKREADLLVKYIEQHPNQVCPCWHSDQHLPASLLAIAAIYRLDSFLEWLLTIPENSRPRTEKISEPFHPFKSDVPRQSSEFVGETALHRAVKAGHLSTVKLLVLHGANLAWIGSRNAKDSCFRIAVAYGHWEICEYILNELTSMNFYGNSSKAYLQLLERAAPSGIVEKFLDRSLASSEKDWKEFSQEFFVNTVKWERWDLFSVILDKIPSNQLICFFGIPFFGNKRNEEGCANAFFKKADKALITKFVDILSRANIFPLDMVLKGLNAQNLECIEGVLAACNMKILLKRPGVIQFELHAEHEIDQWISSDLFNWADFFGSVECVLRSLQKSDTSLEYHKYAFAKLQYFILAAIKKKPDVCQRLADIYFLLLQYSSPFISLQDLETQFILPTLMAVHQFSLEGVPNVLKALQKKSPEFYVQFQSEKLVNYCINHFLPKDSAVIFSVFEKALEKKNMTLIEALISKRLCTGEHPYLLRAIRQDANSRAIATLIREKISLDVKEGGALPLHEACLRNQYLTAYNILKIKPDQLLIPNDQGETFLKLAVHRFPENELKSCLAIAKFHSVEWTIRIRTILNILLLRGYSTFLPSKLSEDVWKKLAQVGQYQPNNLLEKLFAGLSLRIKTGAPIENYIEGYRVIAASLMTEGKIYLRYDRKQPQIGYVNTVIPLICQLLNMPTLDSGLVFQCLQSNTDLCFHTTILNAVFVRGEERLIQCVLDSLQNTPNLPRGLALYFKSDWTPFMTSLQKHLGEYKDSWITSNSAGKVPLQEAIEAGNGYFIEFYLKHLGYPQLPLEKGTRSPLLYAIKKNQLQSVQSLTHLLALKHSEAFTVKDSESKNILHLAASLPQKEIFFELLHTVDRSILRLLLNEKEKCGIGNTPILTYFKDMPAEAIDQRLLTKFQELGADFSVANDEGESPIHWMLVLNGAPLELDFIKQAAFAAVQKFHLFASMPLEVLMKHLTWMNQGDGLRQGVAQRVALKEPLENALEWHALTQTQNGDKWRVQNKRESIIQVVNFFAKYKQYDHAINQENLRYGLTLSQGHLDFIRNLEKTLPDVSGIDIKSLLDLFDKTVLEGTLMPTIQRVDPLGSPLPPAPWTREQLRHNLGQLIERINTETPYTGTPRADTPALSVFYGIKRKILRQFIHLLTLPDKAGANRCSREDNMRAHLIDLGSAADVCATRTLEELRSRRNEMLLLTNENLTDKDLFYLELFTLRQELFLKETRKITSVQGAQNVHNQYKFVHALGVEFGVISPDEITDDPTTQPLSAQEILAIRNRMQDVYNPLKLLLDKKPFRGSEETLWTRMIGSKELSELEGGLNEFMFMYDTADVLTVFEEGEVIKCIVPSLHGVFVPCAQTQLLAALYAYVLKRDNPGKIAVEEEGKLKAEIEGFMNLVAPQGAGLSYLEGLTMDKVLALTPSANLVEQFSCVKSPSKKQRVYKEESLTLAAVEAIQRRKGKFKAGEAPQSPQAAKKYATMNNVTKHSEAAATEAFQSRVSAEGQALEELPPLESRVVLDGEQPMLMKVADQAGKIAFLPPNKQEEKLCLFGQLQ